MTVQYGAFLPHLGPLAQGDVLGRLKTTAQTAGALGFNSVWVADHIDDIPRYQELGASYLYLAFFNFARTYADMMTMMEKFARDVGLA